MKFDKKYYVVKNEDIHKYLDEDELETFNVLTSSIYERKLKETGKEINDYYVINVDEPYIELIKRVIEIGENKKQWDKLQEQMKRDLNVRW
jgi:hypothetical protein